MNIDYQTLYETAEREKTNRLVELSNEYSKKKKLLEIEYEDNKKKIQYEFDNQIEKLDGLLDDNNALSLECKSQKMFDDFDNSFKEKEEFVISPVLIKTNVKNQYHFDKNTPTACVSISILFCYYFSQFDGDINDEIGEIMKSGGGLYNIWRNDNSINMVGAGCVIRMNKGFPTIKEIVDHRKCKTFKSHFTSDCEHFGYLYTDVKEILDRWKEMNQPQHQVK